MDLSVLSFDEIKTLAKTVEGFEIHHATGEANYRAAFQAYVDENPDCLKEEPKTGEGSGEENKAIPAKADGSEVTLNDPEKGEASKDGLVKIKSIHRGKMGSSVGEVDFGEDGEAEVTVEQAEHFCKIEGFDKC